MRKGNREKRERPSKDLSDVITALRPIGCFCRSGSAVILFSPYPSFLFSPVYSFPPLLSSLLTSSLSERESHVSSRFPFLVLSTPVVPIVHGGGRCFVCTLEFVYLTCSFHGLVVCFLSGACPWYGGFMWLMYLPICFRGQLFWSGYHTKCS